MPIGFTTQPEMEGFQLEATFEKMSGGRGFAVYKAHYQVNERLIDPIIYVPVSALPKGKHPKRIHVSISATDGTPWQDH